MNWKKLTLGITAINLLAWNLIELWSKRYAESNIAIGAGFLIGLHLAGYYIIAIASKVPKPQPPQEKVTPQNCTGHDWQRNVHTSLKETCVICGAERGTKF